MRPYGPAVLRVAVGAVFFAHGAQKLFGVWGGGGPGGTAAFLAQLGLTPAYPLAILVGLVEFARGAMLIAGSLTRFAALALIVNMAIAVWKVHLVNGFFLNWNLVAGQGHGYEFNIVLMGALASLAITGAGTWSVDAQRARAAESRSYGRDRLRAGHV